MLKLEETQFRFGKICGLFLDYDILNITASYRVAVTHKNSKSTKNIQKIRKYGPLSFVHTVKPKKFAVQYIVH